MRRLKPTWQKPVVTSSTPLNLYLFIRYPTAIMLISPTDQEIMFKKERRDRDDEGIPVRWARRAFKDLKEFDVVKVDGIVGVVQKVWENAVDMIRVTDDAGLENCVYARFNKFLVATVPRKRKR